MTTADADMVRPTAVPFAQLHAQDTPPEQDGSGRYVGACRCGASWPLRGNPGEVAIVNAFGKHVHRELTVSRPQLAALKHAAGHPWGQLPPDLTNAARDALVERGLVERTGRGGELRITGRGLGTLAEIERVRIP